MGNLKDAALEELSNKGNGNHAYIDSLQEARKVLVSQASGTLITIAKDVKIQVEFNPAAVAAYRLIGYENRLLRKEDFNDDAKDAGDIGAGHTVTALYEIVPVGQAIDLPTMDPLKYQAAATTQGAGDEMLTVKLRYKEPDGQTSQLISLAVRDDAQAGQAPSDDFRFAAAVAGFGMILRDSKHVGNYTLAAVEELASAARGQDAEGYRAEFIRLVKAARELKRGV
jgi:Ca-activated chloride channel family protein